MRAGAPLLVAVAVIAAACSSGDDAAPATEPASTPPATDTAAGTVIEAPDWEPATRAEELALDMSNSGEVTLQDAVDAFGLRVADFPGVTPSGLPAGDAFSASYALALLLSRRSDLSDEQQAALDAYLGDGVEIGSVDADGTIVTVTDGPTSSTAVSGWRRPAATLQKYLSLLGEVRKDWIAKYPGHPRHDSYTLGWFDEPGESGMLTFEETDGGKLVCRVRVHTTFRDSNPSDDKIRFFFAHELFHCMQWRWAAEDWKAANPAADPFAEFPVRNPHPWLYDGSADWAAADLYRDRVIGYNDIRPHWFTDATKPLGARAYDAWPLFENAYRNGYDVYEKIRAMHVSPAWTVARTLQEGGLDGVVFRMLWSSRTLRRAAWGDEWRMDWVWRGHESMPPVDNDITVSGIGLGSYAFDGPGDFSQPQLRVPVSGEVGILTVSPAGAPITTRTKVGTRTVGDGSSGRFCFDPSECSCPEGQSADAWPMEGNEMLFSFAASEETPTSTLVAAEWDPQVECEDEQPDEGSSNGDPHLVSFDGLAFDVVTLGEFVLARDAAGDFEVQTRHEPFGFGAGTTAVALSDGATRVTFTMPELLAGEEPTVRVDGAIQTSRELAAGSLRVTVGDEDSFVTWPDGSTVRLHWFLGWFVTVTVPAERSGRMEGLLGAADGDLRNDLRLPGGTIVDTNDAAAHESTYALAWAVDETTTLFDYEAGQSVATFRVPHPRPEPPEVDPSVLERCAGALGPAAATHEVTSCAYDVAATGDDGFVAEYVAVVADREDGPALADAIPVRPTNPPLTVGEVTASRAGEPTVTLAVNETGTIDAAAGTVVVARAASCGDDVFADLAVWKADDRDFRASARLCDPQRLGRIGLGPDDEWVHGEAYVWIPDDGPYVVGVDGILGPPEQVGNVDVYLDPQPEVLDAGDLVDGGRTTLQRIGDTLVLLPDPAARFDTSGLDAACAVEVYWTEDFPSPGPRNLGACDHTTEIDFPPTDQTIPIVVFNRTPDEIAITLERVD